MTKEQIHIGSMSHETAIGILKLMLEAMETYDGISPTPERVNAVKMAIEALENEPLIVPIAEIKYDEDKLKELANKAVLSVTPQEPNIIKIRSEIEAYANQATDEKQRIAFNACLNLIDNYTELKPN